MTSKNRAPVELRFSDGTILTRWKSLQWRDSYTDPLGSLDFTAHPLPKDRPKYQRLMIKGGLVDLYINGARQLTALIVGVDKTISNDGFEFSVSCKSLLATPYEGSVDPYLAQTFEADTPVSDAVLKALEPYGFGVISADMGANLAALTGKSIEGIAADDVIVDELKHKDVLPQGTETAYGFCARLFTRLGLLLKVDVNGALLLTKPDYDQEPSYTLVQDSQRRYPGNYILSNPPIQIIDSNDGQFSEIVVIGKEADRKGQKSATAPTHGVIVSGTERPAEAQFQDAQLFVINSGRMSYSGLGAPFKPLYKFDKKARDIDRALNMATIMQGARAIRGYQIRCAVDGLLSTEGAIWTTGTIARAIIDVDDIDEEMFVLETTKSVDRDQGQMTQLTLVPKHALILGEA